MRKLRSCVTTCSTSPSSLSTPTTNNLLTYYRQPSLAAEGHRWVAELTEFSFEIKYPPGKSNIDADVVSRLPLDPVNTWKTALPATLSGSMSQRALTLLTQN